METPPKTRTIVLIGVLAAAYYVGTVALAPMSYNALQFRVSEVLKPLALFTPYAAVAFGIGNFFANLFSPFGVWDWGAMPIVDMVAALTCWHLRDRPTIAVTLQAIVISAGVAIFPLGFGGHLPPPGTFPAVLVSELILLIGGYHIIWKRYGQDIIREFPLS